MSFNFNYKCKQGPASYDATQLYNAKPDDNRVRMLTECNSYFNLSKDAAVDCPKDAYLNFACVDEIGRDLLCNELINQPRPVDQARIKLERSTFDKWRNISIEGCTQNRVKSAEEQAVARLIKNKVY